MGILKLIGIIAFLAWTVWYVLAMRRTYKTHLQYFFKPDVNLMAKYEVGARYDAVQLKGKFWKITLAGVFLVPLRVVFVLWMLTTFYSWTWVMMKVFGSKFLLEKKILID
jgi:hypothetical protein